MKKLILTLSITMIALLTIAQSTRYEAIIHLEDGKTAEGMVALNEYMPWTYQKSVSLFDKSLADKKRIKKKEKTKYKASKVMGFEIEGRYFESRKLLVPAGEYGGTLKGLPKYTFLERIVEGEILVFRAYSYPPSVASGITFEEIYKSIRNDPQYFISKEKGKKGKVKYLGNVNIQKWIKDAPETSEKFENGDYGNFKRKKGKKLGNFLKGQVENENPQLMIDVIKDYNAEMNSK